MHTRRDAALEPAGPVRPGNAAEAMDRPVPPWLDRSAYPFRSRWLRLPSGQAMHYVDEGAGEPVLFVHGDASAAGLPEPTDLFRTDQEPGTKHPRTGAP